jgi:general secretion pathway protein G
MKKSFTLIELIVVIAIIAVLAAIIAPNAFRAIEKAKISQAIADLRAYKTAIAAFRVDTGSLPEAWEYVTNEYCLTDNGLLTNKNNWTGWDGPYLEKVKSIHPWRGTYCLVLWHSGDSNPSRELFLQFNSGCYPYDIPGLPDNGNYNCGIPEEAARKIDSVLDDGNLLTGNFRRGAPWCCATGGSPWSQICTCWILLWNENPQVVPQP